MTSISKLVRAGSPEFLSTNDFDLVNLIGQFLLITDGRKSPCEGIEFQVLSFKLLYNIVMTVWNIQNYAQTKFVRNRHNYAYVIGYFCRGKKTRLSTGVRAYCKPIIRKLRLQNPLCPAGLKDDPCLTRNFTCPIPRVCADFSFNSYHRRLYLFCYLQSYYSLHMTNTPSTSKPTLTAHPVLFL